MHAHDESTAQPPPGLFATAALIFAQMLPATLLTPAIRPLFAAQHGGNEHAMHAFMALNMVGAAIALPIVGGHAERMREPRRLIAALLLADGLLLYALCLPLPTFAVLSLRVVEGAAHVSAAALLMAEAAALGRQSGTGRAMGVAGAALMFAVAFGSSIGGQLVSWELRAPFWVGAGLELLVALWLVTHPGYARAALPATSRRPLRLLARHRELWVPLAAAFVGRFTIGCVIVSFALFAHKHHGASDRAVGFFFSLITLPFALSMYPLSRLSDRVPRASMMALGGAIYGLCLLLIGYVPYGALPLVMVGAGLSSAALFAPTLCYAASLGGERKEGAMALLNTAGSLGMLLGPAVAGVTAALAGGHDPIAGYRAVFALAGLSVFCWLAAGLGWLMRRVRSEVTEAI